MDTKLEIIKYLKELANGAMPEKEHFGLCGNLAEKFRPSDLNDVHELIKRWPEHSGEDGYPVKNPKQNLKAMCAYIEIFKWGDCEYGKARRRLCGWLAYQLEAGS